MSELESSIIEADQLRRRILRQKAQQAAGEQPDDPVSKEEVRRIVEMLRKGRISASEASGRAKSKATLPKDASLDDLLGL